MPYIYSFKCALHAQILHVETIMLANFAQNKLNLTYVLNKNWFKT